MDGLVHDCSPSFHNENDHDLQCHSYLFFLGTRYSDEVKKGYKLYLSIFKRLELVIEMTKI